MAGTRRRRRRVAAGSSLLELSQPSQIARAVEHRVGDGRPALVARRQEVGRHGGDDGGAGGDGGRGAAERRQDAARTADDHRRRRAVEEKVVGRTTAGHEVLKVGGEMFQVQSSTEQSSPAGKKT